MRYDRTYVSVYYGTTFFFGILFCWNFLWGAAEGITYSSYYYIDPKKTKLLDNVDCDLARLGILELSEARI